jgi:hypothetical protein
MSNERANSPIDAGALKRVLDVSREEMRCSRDALTVLQVDPYRFDTPANHRDATWVADQLERAIGGFRRIHWRGLHYAIVAAGNIIKPSGAVYRNTEEDWHWLLDHAAKAARWLGYVPFERISDSRNSDPVIHRKPEGAAPWRYFSTGIDLTEIPGGDSIRLATGVAQFEGRQPYSLSIFGEKASLEDVLLPIAQKFEADLFLSSGEISDTLLHRMAKDGAADGRPMAVFILADFDPAGHQMAVSIGRKLQALRDLFFPSLEFEVVAVALTVHQVRDLGLPSTPLKDTEKRADRWRAAFGVEQTEIDALATLRPLDLTKIVETALEPYYDGSLGRRVWAAHREAQVEAERAIEQRIDGAAIGAFRERVAELLAEVKEELTSIDAKIHTAAEGAFDELSKPIVPSPDMEGKASRQAPLISSAWSWADATIALKQRKDYGAKTAPGGES